MFAHKANDIPTNTHPNHHNISIMIDANLKSITLDSNNKYVFKPS